MKGWLMMALTTEFGERPEMMKPMVAQTGTMLKMRRIAAWELAPQILKLPHSAKTIKISKVIRMQ